MAVGRKSYFELHILSPSWQEFDLQERIDAIPLKLIELLSRVRGGQFTGEEVSSTKVVFFFESPSATEILQELSHAVEGLELLGHAIIVVQKESLPTENDIRFPLADLDIWTDRVAQHEKLSTKRSGGRRPKVNDYYAVPLSNGRFGHLKYIYRDPQWGDLVQVLAVITEDRPSQREELLNAKPLFPPVNSPVRVGVQVGGWIFLGTGDPTDEFQFPTFRSTDSLLFSGHKPGVYNDWWLWSGGDDRQMVGSLTEEQRRLEYEVVWPPLLLAKRIATGENEYDSFL